ncbi:MAG: VCBS repeat-containing protein [Pseudomonadota bacterium]
MRSLAALALALSAGAAAADTITAARYAEPTTRYAHAVLGDAIEYGALILSLSDGSERQFVLPETRVFEDTEPRLADLDQDGAPEVIVVESDSRLGARLVVYGPAGEIASTPNIGRSFRWLAPVGAADLDADGAVEIAFVDRPHLAKRLRVWRFRDGALNEVTFADGFSNHRIGEPDIAGGIRDCGQGPEMIVATGDWRRLVAVTLSNGTLAVEDIGPHKDRASFATAMACQTPS